MKRMILWLALLLCCALGLPAQTMTVSGSKVIDSTGANLPSGTISFQPVDLQGHKIGYRMGGNGQVISRAVTATVTAGAFTITLPDTSLTAPVNVCFSVTATDNVTGDSLFGSGYTCVQPSSTASSWCTSTTCNFDAYEPNTPGLPVETVSGGGGGGGTTFNGGTVANPISAPQISSAKFLAGDQNLQLGADGGSGSKDAITFNGQGVISGSSSQRLGMSANSTGSSDLFFDQPSTSKCYTYRWSLATGWQVCDNGLIPLATTFGDTVTLHADPLTNMQAATKQYVDAHAGSGGSGTFTGGTVSGATTFGSTLTLHADPLTNMQAATKQYVDAQIGATITIGGVDSTQSSFDGGGRHLANSDFDVSLEGDNLLNTKDGQPLNLQEQLTWLKAGSLVGQKAICLADGTNCPAGTGSGSGSGSGSPIDYVTQVAAVSVGGIAYPKDLSYYDNNAPTLGSYSSGSSTAAYLQFDPNGGTNEYAQGTIAVPAQWTTTSAYVTFSSPVTTGNVVWTLQTSCVLNGNVAGTESWSTGVSVTTTVPGTAGNYTVTAVFTNIAQDGVNSCPSNPSAPGELTYRISRSTDTAAGFADLHSITFAVSRSE